GVQSTEKSQFYYLRLPRIVGCKGLESFVECYQILAPLGRCDDIDIERGLSRSPSSLLVLARARKFHQNAAHHLRRNGAEVRAVLPMDLLAVDQPHVGLVD